MRVLLDNNVNVRFKELFTGHDVKHVLDLSWDRLKNGELIRSAEEDGFEVMLTGDKNMQYQQNLTHRTISIVVLNSLFLKWSHIAALAPQVQDLLDAGLAPGSFVVIDPPAAT